MQEKEAEELFNKGLAAVDSGDTVLGIACLEKFLHLERTPLFDSYFAVCLARELGDFDEALALCMSARDEEPSNPAHYLNLGRVYIACGRKRDAIRAFRDGLLFDHDRRIIAELNRIGWRNMSVFPMLSREHRLNVILGKIGKKLRVR